MAALRAARAAEGGREERPRCGGAGRRLTSTAAPSGALRLSCFNFSPVFLSFFLSFFSLKFDTFFLMQILKGNLLLPTESFISKKKSHWFSGQCTWRILHFSAHQSRVTARFENRD